MDYPSLKDFNPKNQIVIVRTDYNVPIKDGKIVDDLRIRASLPTLKYLVEKGAKQIIVISHMGRPDGTNNAELSLKLVAERLAELLPGQTVEFADDVSGPEVEEKAQSLPKGGILVLENLRFYPGEKKNSQDFANEIIESTHAEAFVQDGFAVIHRAHASTDAMARELPSYMGLLVEKEVSALKKITENPKHPFYVIIGGAKVEDKQPLIEEFAKIADEVWVGGKIAADGYQPNSKNIHVARFFNSDAKGNKLDVSNEAGDELAKIIKNEAATVLWNGVFGKVEDPEFAKNSEKIALAIGEKPELTSVICGGDTTAFVENLQKTHPELKYTLISTGGGAALELLSGNEMPGLEALN